MRDCEKCKCKADLMGAGYHRNCPKCNAFLMTPGERIDQARYALQKALKEIDELGINVRSSDEKGYISLGLPPVMEIKI